MINRAALEGIPDDFDFFNDSADTLTWLRNTDTPQAQDRAVELNQQTGEYWAERFAQRCDT